MCLCPVTRRRAGWGSGYSNTQVPFLEKLIPFDIRSSGKSYLLSHEIGKQYTILDSFTGGSPLIRMIIFFGSGGCFSGSRSLLGNSFRALVCACGRLCRECLPLRPLLELQRGEKFTRWRTRRSHFLDVPLVPINVAHILPPLLCTPRTSYHHTPFLYPVHALPLVSGCRLSYAKIAPSPPTL